MDQGSSARLVVVKRNGVRRVETLERVHLTLQSFGVCLRSSPTCITKAARDVDHSRFFSPCLFPLHHPHLSGDCPAVCTAVCDQCVPGTPSLKTSRSLDNGDLWMLMADKGPPWPTPVASVKLQGCRRFPTMLYLLQTIMLVGWSTPF